MATCLRWVVGTCVVLSMLGLMMPGTGLDLPAQLVFHLLTGWFSTGQRLFEWARDDYIMLMTAVVLFLIFAFGLHAFCRRVYHRSAMPLKPWLPPREWQSQWSLVMVATLLAAMLAGMSMVGIFRQMAQLAAGDEPIVSPIYRQLNSQNQARWQLKGLGVAFMDHFDKRQNMFPAGATSGPHGQLYHGWLTQLLPYLDQKSLHERIDLQQPWTAEANRDVFSTVVPELLRTERGSEQVNAAGYGLTSYAANVHVLGGTHAGTFQEIKDGSSQTILAGEIANDLPAWGATTNWRDPALGLQGAVDGFGSVGEQGIGVVLLFLDGSVRQFSRDTDPAVLRALATPDGGETMYDSQW